MPDRLLTFVVYVHPVDHPDAVVVRVFEITRGSAPRPGTAWLFTDLATAVDWLQSRGLHMLNPGPDDDVSVHSTWL